MAIDIIARGIAAGKADLENGKVPASQLPSYVDDVVEYGDSSEFPATGESGKIYVAKDTGYTYRWSGSMYIQIGLTELDDNIGLVSLSGTSGTLSDADYAKASKPFAQLSLAGETYIKSLEDVDKLEFRSTNFSDAENIVDSIAVKPHRITVLKADKTWEYAD